MSVKSYQSSNVVVKKEKTVNAGSSADNSVHLLEASILPAGTYQFNANIGISTGAIQNINSAALSIGVGFFPVVNDPVAECRFDAPQTFFSGSVSAAVYSDGEVPINVTCSANTLDGSAYNMSYYYLSVVRLS